MKKAFTLVELILTMMILSIVAYIASGLIAKTFIAYNQTNAINRANLKVENAITFIANRLENAITNTIIKRQSNSSLNFLSPINMAPSNYSVLEWIGSDVDGFRASIPLAWSGFCDIKRSTATSIITPASNLDLENNVLKNISSGKVNLTNNTVALFFPGNYDYQSIGFFGNFLGSFLAFNSNGVGVVTNYVNSSSPYYLNSTIILNSNSSKRIVEQYKLAWSAYSVVPINCNNGLCDLEFRYNYRPWNNETSTSRGAKKSLLINNVSVFKTYATQNRIHIKLCIQDKYLGKKTISICKEKVVYK